MVLRSLYLDPLMDGALDSRAEEEGITKAELMRRFLADGLRRPATAFAGYDTSATRDASKPKSSSEAAPKRADKKPAAKPARRAAVGSSRR